MKLNLLRIGLWLALGLALSGPARAADSVAAMAAAGKGGTNSLEWSADHTLLTARIESWPLLALLENVAQTTGWQVFVEPGLSRNIAAKFSDVPLGQALGRMLGDINFTILPDDANPGARRLFVFRNSRDRATQTIKSRPKVSGSAIPIPNELVVKLKPGSKVKIDELARSLGAKVVGRMDEQGAYRLQFGDAAAAQSARTELAQNPDVQAVESNFNIDPPPQLNLSGGGGSAEPQLNPATNNHNCQLVVGLIDTAIQPLSPGLAPFFKTPIQVAGDYTPDPATMTHGTAMATAILQMLQQRTGGTTSVRVQPVDVYGQNATTTTFDVANGIIQAVNKGANILNLSLGSSGDSQFLHDTIDQVVARGIPVYAAAGNEPVTTATYPAAYPGVIAVTASDPNGQIASYANRGSFVDLMAPGTDIVPFNGQSFMVQGTSTATAFASGMAAGIADASHACADQANALLVKNLKTAPKPGQ